MSTDPRLRAVAEMMREAPEHLWWICPVCRRHPAVASRADALIYAHDHPWRTLILRWMRRLGS